MLSVRDDRDEFWNELRKRLTVKNQYASKFLELLEQGFDKKQKVVVIKFADEDDKTTRLDGRLFDASMKNGFIKDIVELGLMTKHGIEYDKVYMNINLNEVEKAEGKNSFLLKGMDTVAITFW